MIKRALILLIVALLVLAGVFLLQYGIAVLGYNIYGIPKIQETSNELDSKILKSTELNKVAFKSKNDELNTSLRQLIAEKERYQLVLSQSTSSQIAQASTINKYEMEFLWTKVGNYASANKVRLVMNVTSGSTSETKNLEFTLNGGYIGITDFIYSIENDSKLAFKIENFKLEPETSDESLKGTLKGTFIVRNIIINI